MKRLIKIRVPMIVTADGKWAVNGCHETRNEPDWSWIDEMCDHEKATINPMRYWIETAVEVPETGIVIGAAIPEDAPSPGRGGDAT
jgi:hypothetical protein